MRSHPDWQGVENHMPVEELEEEDTPVIPEPPVPKKDSYEKNPDIYVI